ncbi:regulatory protein RecX [Spongiimicrobium sp. 3-5]|uniref:regulatory protein RecX n=1 Tax=Spongiimicrobium sp. 3-5 TaxID=3332596 RepID=UPI00397FB56B
MQGTTSYTLTEAQKKMERYCSYQDRCHMEVLTRLRQMGMIPEAIAHIVNHLIQENYLNEERFSKSFARGKFKIKKWGKIRITAELKKRNISRFNITIGLSEIDEADYLDTLDAIAKKRLASLSKIDEQLKRRKLADYLFYRGWESHLVYEKIAELFPS